MSENTLWVAVCGVVQADGTVYERRKVSGMLQAEEHLECLCDKLDGDFDGCCCQIEEAVTDNGGE